jgi:hypothetical protein
MDEHELNGSVYTVKPYVVMLIWKYAGIEEMSIYSFINPKINYYLAKKWYGLLKDQELIARLLREYKFTTYYCNYHHTHMIYTDESKKLPEEIKHIINEYQLHTVDISMK